MRRVLVLALSCAALAAAAPARGADPPPGALTGTLARVARAGIVKLGYREDAAPFSFVSKAGVPAGYSIDLCREVVEAIREAVGARRVGVEFVRVTAADRIDRVARGEVDLECGSTTNTGERRARVAFSPTIFVAGTKLAVPRGSRVRSLADLAGRAVAVVRGTTNEAALREVVRMRRLAIELAIVDDLAQAFALLDADKVQAVGGDDILLLGEAVRAGRRASYAIVGEYLSFERYAIAFARGDPDLAALVDAALRGLATTGELRGIYNKWFVRTLPNGERLGLPMSAELRRTFEILGLPPE
ncbi:MAG: amino acid ABC transporter substrate-binding protein [Betaproteobacteria bacterium]|nr:amino acid ABC transporter substrate-binding protein [Betaproteobacteria bacterium]MDH5286736.1 amino acid ABC transporter substrate-binding protein [Betaproteobacteria bacterium]